MSGSAAPTLHCHVMWQIKIYVCVYDYDGVMFLFGLSSCNTALGHLCNWLRRTSPCSRCRHRSANYPWCRRHERRWTLLGRTGETLNKQTKTIGATVSKWIPSVWSLSVWIICTCIAKLLNFPLPSVFVFGTNWSPYVTFVMIWLNGSW